MKGEDGTEGHRKKHLGLHYEIVCSKFSDVDIDEM